MFSVIIAAYNGEKYIIEQIDSVMHQTVPPDKIYIYDDCSTDNTIALVSDWINKNDIKNIVIRKNAENKRYTRNFLEALFEIDDDYLFLCDQDDVWEQNKIEFYEKAIESFGDVEIPLLITSGYSVTDKDLNVLHTVHANKTGTEYISLARLIKHYSYPGMTFCLNRSLKNKVKENFNKDHVVFHDFFIALCAEKYGKLLCINDSLVLYRQHGDNQIGVSGKKNKTRAYWKKIIQQGNAGSEMAKHLFPDNQYVCAKAKFGSKRMEFHEKRRFFSIALHFFSYMRFYGIKSYIADLYFSIF